MILVTGGAGYIGSHTVAELLRTGVPESDIIIADNLSTGHKESVLGGKLCVGDLRDSEFVSKLFKENDIDSVIHFAAFSQVGESVVNPLKYYENNVQLSINLVRHMVDAGVKKLVFSSTAAVYGEPKNIPINETDPCIPTNPYGQTKLAVEGLLKWADNAYGLKYIALRYFNAAGALESGEIGERHDPETHLIPIVLQAANGERDCIKVFGTDYPTPDGTCVRDYIHVTDLASSHIAALKRLKDIGESGIYNLGNGAGFSVKQVIDVCRQVTNRDIPVELAERRAGDPATLVASNQKAMAELNLKFRYASLESIIQTAWNFHGN
ncbi:MAG: UDP-glucose 4-epimerase GalE [Clostridiales bacterium]|jgi:UDP-glucose 4-epimerase|nr:UDP-glucose 4-epimerase GalE [Clostridiales bacterium]